MQHGGLYVNSEEMSLKLVYKLNSASARISVELHKCIQI